MPIHNWIALLRLLTHHKPPALPSLLPTAQLTGLLSLSLPSSCLQRDELQKQVAATAKKASGVVDKMLQARGFGCPVVIGSFGQCAVPAVRWWTHCCRQGGSWSPGNRE